MTRISWFGPMAGSAPPRHFWGSLTSGRMSADSIGSKALFGIRLSKLPAEPAIRTSRLYWPAARSVLIREVAALPGRAVRSTVMPYCFWKGSISRVFSWSPTGPMTVTLPSRLAAASTVSQSDDALAAGAAALPAGLGCPCPQADRTRQLARRLLIDAGRARNKFMLVRARHILPSHANKHEDGHCFHSR